MESWDDNGRTRHFLRISQPLVRPLRTADGYVAKPTEAQIREALSGLGGGRWAFFGSLDGDGATDSGDVEAARFQAANVDYIVTDFKPGANTFIDEDTGEVRFIDPQVLPNWAGDGFEASSMASRRRDGVPAADPLPAPPVEPESPQRKKFH